MKKEAGRRKQDQIKLKQLDQEILALIQRGVNQPKDDGIFNVLALEIFKYQYKYNLPYQHFCQAVSTHPSSIKNWRQIPLVPTWVFKETVLASFPRQKAKKVFYTSGTTLKKSGRHYLENLILYEHSLWVNFKAHFLIENEKWPLLILTPSPLEAPHSSLCHMMGVLQREMGSLKNPYFIHQGTLQIERLKNTLRHFCKIGKPVLLAGTAFSIVHFLDHTIAKKWKIKLTCGSRLMETGGYKGKSRELSKIRLYHLIEDTLGVPQTHIVNEYGMTEMGSQFYDNSFINANLLRKEPRFKTIPPWVRTRILNPHTLEEVPVGEIGILAHYDLANRSSVIAILTEDIGINMKDGFEILGRAPQVESRGCSLALEEWLKLKDHG